jgi:hypothetical protein
MPDLYTKRLETCETCHHYMGRERCKLLDLGCRQKFRDHLDNPDVMCPAGKWKIANLTNKSESGIML